MKALEADRHTERLWTSNSWFNADDRNWCELHHAVVGFSSFVVIHLEFFWGLVSVHFSLARYFPSKVELLKHMIIISRKIMMFCAFFFVFFSCKMLTKRQEVHETEVNSFVFVQRKFSDKNGLVLASKKRICCGICGIILLLGVVGLVLGLVLMP